MKKLNKSVLDKLNISEDNILQKSELKKIIGGYGTGGYGTDIGGYGSDGYGAGGYGTEPNFKCVHEYHDSSGEKKVRETECFMGFELAVSFCEMWAAAGMVCKCYKC